MSEVPEQVEFQEALEAAMAGGPERHRAKTAEQGKMPVNAKPLKGIAPGVLEIVSDFKGGTFRAVYIQ